jgi:hypothetical protein
MTRGDEDDPTADFLAAVRPGETPWRVDRPEGPPPEPDERVPEEPVRWRGTRAASRAAATAAAYGQTAAMAGWLVAGALSEEGRDEAPQDVVDIGTDSGG